MSFLVKMLSAAVLLVLASCGANPAFAQAPRPSLDSIVEQARDAAANGGGVVMESHQAPIPQDAWHFGSGFLSGRSLQTISYHRAYGEVSRVRVAILDSEVT